MKLREGLRGGFNLKFAYKLTGLLLVVLHTMIFPVVSSRGSLLEMETTEAVAVATVQTMHSTTIAVVDTGVGTRTSAVIRADRCRAGVMATCILNLNLVCSNPWSILSGM